MPAVLPLIEAAHWLGLVPLVWLAGIALAGQRVRAAEWWLAAAFGVSFVADTAAHLGINPEVAGNLYPMLQSAMIGLVLADRNSAVHLAGVLLTTAVAGVLLEGSAGRDVLLRTVAWGSAAWLGSRTVAAFRPALVVTYGLGLLAWYAYALAPGWPTWGVYQLTRLAGTVLFCAAVRHPWEGRCRTGVA